MNLNNTIKSLLYLIFLKENALNYNKVKLNNRSINIQNLNKLEIIYKKIFNTIGKSKKKKF